MLITLQWISQYNDMNSVFTLSLYEYKYTEKLDIFFLLFLKTSNKEHKLLVHPEQTA